MSLYWVVTTMTTVGFGDIKPVTFAEITMSLVTMLVGATVFSYIVGNMASIVGNLDGRSAAFKSKMDGLMEFMHEHDLPRELRRRIMKFYEYTYAHPTATVADTIVNDLSVSLRADVARHLNRDIVKSVPLFNPEHASPHFVDAALLSLKPVQVLTVICEKLTVGCLRCALPGWTSRCAL